MGSGVDMPHQGSSLPQMGGSLLSSRGWETGTWQRQHLDPGGTWTPSAWTHASLLRLVLRAPCVSSSLHPRA